LGKNADNKISTGDKSKDLVYLFGPQNKIYKFVLKTRSWEALKADKSSLFKAGMKHMSMVAVND
jgi:hypothetical protein